MATTRDKDLWCVGVLYDSQDDKKAGKISGYRVYGCAVEGYKDVDVATMQGQLRRFPNRVRGLKLSDKSGDVIGACGDIEDYTKFVKGAVSSNEKMLLIGKLPDSGIKIFMLNSCWWVDYDILRALIKRGTVFANAVLSGTQNADFDALTTIDGVGVAEYDPAGVDKNGRLIVDLYDDTAKHFGLAVDVDEMRRKIAKHVENNEDAQEEVLTQAIAAAKASGVRIINRHMDDTGGVYLKNASGMTVEDRLLRASRVLREYAPFMYSAYSALRKVDTYDISTAAVSLREFLYNPSFINAISDAYLQHLLEHEISHVLMEHVARGFDRRPDIWNIACDLSVNARIAFEHRLRFIGDERPIRCSNTGDSERVLNSTISSVLNRCNSSKIDIEKDTATSIYFEIIEELQQQQQSGADHGEQQSGGGQGQQNQGQDSQKGDGGGSPEYNAGYAQGFRTAQCSRGSEQGQENQGGEQGQGVGSAQNNPEWQQGYRDGFYDGWNSTGEMSGEERGGKSGIQQGGTEHVTFRGEKIKLDPTDIVMTPEEAAMSKSALERASKSFLTGVVERHRRQFDRFGGESGSYYERLVEEALAPRVNWKSAIRRRFMDVSGRDRSYRTPDRRLASRGMYLAGNSAQIPDMLKNLKVAFDMSGSIGSEDVGVCLSQLEQLLKEFKCDMAELFFWDTQIRERVEFKDYRELLKKARYSGGGGTDCNCVFAEFESEPYKRRQKGAPGYIIIFTDGVFAPIEEKYKKYGNNTIWVLPDFATTRFRAPFGLKSEFTPTDSKSSGSR